MRFLLILSLLLFSGLEWVLASGPDNPARWSLNFNTGWAFHLGDEPAASATGYNDGQWEAVNIPHVMRLEKKHNGGGDVFQGIGWYRRYFRLPGQYKGKRLTLHFEGIQMDADLFLNGEKIADHHGGYMGFVVDVSDKVNFTKDNVLAIRVSNLDDPQTPPGKPMRQLDFNYYGGIYRDVRLLVTDPLYISDPLEADITAGGGIRLSYPQVNEQQAVIQVQTHVVNSFPTPSDTRVVSILLDNQQREVARVSATAVIAKRGDHRFLQQLQVQHPALWCPGRPYLYKLVSRVYRGKKLLDEVQTPAGIRSVSFRSPDGKADGFYLNGQKLYLRGANRHQAYAYVGDAASNSMQYRDALLIKQGGFDAVRASHYPASPAFLNACDEIGLLVIECQPGWQYYSDDPVFTQRTMRDIREMIRRDRNHPSIFLWETSLNESPTPAAWMEQAVNTAHSEMPAGQLYTADDLNSRSVAYYDVFYKVVNPDGSDPQPGKPSLTREWGDTWYADASRENGLRASRIYSEKGLINQCILRQNALNGSLEERMGGYWDHAGLDANPRIGGYFLWSFNDYTRGGDPVTAFSGVVDIDRYPKFGYYQMKAMQSARNPVYGPMVYIASYNDRPDVDTATLVFSNCDQVRLYRNGTLIGEESREANAATAPFIAAKGGSPYFRFPVGSYVQGALKAEGLIDGKVVCTHEVRTPGNAHHLEIIPPDDKVMPIADGTDMIPVYIKVCDEQGNLVPSGSASSQTMVRIQVTGEGELIGEGNTRIGVSPQHAEGGIAYALIRTGAKAGHITVTAESHGLTGDRIQLTTYPSRHRYVPDGLHPTWTRGQDSLFENPTADLAETMLAPQGRLALKDAEVTLLSGQPDPDLHNLLDDDLSSVWKAADRQFPKVIVFDLKHPYHLSHFQILWGKDSDWYTYTLEGSMDGSDWQTIGRNSTVSGQDYAFKNIQDGFQARYIRLTMSAIRPESSQPAIREIRWYGSPFD